MNGVWRLWTTVAVVFVGLVMTVGGDLSELMEADSCYDRAHESSSRPGMAGGYSEVEDPSNDEHVPSIVQLSMTRLNSLADNKYRLNASASDSVEAFRQVWPVHWHREKF